MKLRTRLERLLKRVPTTGCPACRDRAGRIVMLTFRALADGTQVPEGTTGAPDPCPRCGRVPEQVIEVVEQIVATKEEAQRALGQ